MSAPAQQRATALVPGRDFPRNFAELRAWFPDDGARLDYLEWLRWPEGFVCPRCGGDGSRLADGRHGCEPCHRREVLLPGVHRIASLAKRWLLGTHQGAVEGDHLQAYLDEFTFRFNRRQSEFRGLLFRRLLEPCVQVGPVSYQALVVNSVPKSQPHLPPGGSHRARATSLTAAETPIPHPWRAHNGW